jgi:hypothetical protein
VRRDHRQGRRLRLLRQGQPARSGQRHRRRAGLPGANAANGRGFFPLRGSCPRSRRGCRPAARPRGMAGSRSGRSG